MGLELDRGYLKVDERYETSEKSVYGAGDGGPALAGPRRHLPGHSGRQRDVRPCRPDPLRCLSRLHLLSAPGGSIGLTEEKAKEDGIAYKIGKFPFAASGKAVAANHPEGFVKLIVGEPQIGGEILGAHIIGSHATELITEYGLGMKLEPTVDEIHQTIHAHPHYERGLGERPPPHPRRSHTYLNKFELQRRQPLTDQ